MGVLNHSPPHFFEIGSLTESSIHQMARLTGRSSRNAHMSCHSPTCAPSLRIQPYKLRSPCSSSRYCANWTFSSLLLIHLNSRLKFLSCGWQTAVLSYGRGGNKGRNAEPGLGGDIGKGETPQPCPHRLPFTGYCSRSLWRCRLTAAKALPGAVTSRNQNACLRVGCRPHHQNLAGGLLDCHRVSSPGWDVVSQLWRESRVMGQEGGAGWR